MHIPKKETLDTVLDYRFKPQDNETSEKVKRLYDMSRSLFLDAYKNNELLEDLDGAHFLEIKLGIKSAVKQGYSCIIISYNHPENYFSVYAMNWPWLPRLRSWYFSLVCKVNDLPPMKVDHPIIYGDRLYKGITRSVADSVSNYSVMEVVKAVSDPQITFYKPGKWEELVEKLYKERVVESIKSPASPKLVNK